ncbi:MAG TPA: response regulator [Candidatus Angelobacter sp.]|jgi:CheY-like chemotaxis protein
MGKERSNFSPKLLSFATCVARTLCCCHLAFVPTCEGSATAATGYTNYETTLAITQKVLEEYGLTVKTAGSASAAEHLLKTAKFDLGVFDYELPDALNLAVARSTYANPKMVFALLRTGHMKTSTASGSTFVVQKPFTADLFARSLRAAYGTMIQERRLAFRHPEKGNQRLHSVNILDLSQTGMCVVADRFPLAGNPRAGSRYRHRDVDARIRAHRREICSCSAGGTETSNQLAGFEAAL